MYGHERLDGDQRTLMHACTE